MTKKSKQKQQKSAKTKRPQSVNTTKIAENVTNAVMSKLSMKDSFLGQVGRFAGNGISKIFGLGAYKMSRNSLYDSTTGAQVPFMHSTSESIVFRHREYIGDISSSTAFTNQTFPVNPGLQGTFPYLSTLAAAFQEYKFRGLIFEFKSTGATALVSGTNTAMGTISMVAQYRADAPPPTNKQEVLNQMWSADGKTSESFILPIECAPKENPMSVQYIRGGEGFAGDVKMYDLCTLQVSAVGSQGSNIVGELWASYEVEFFKPRMSETGGVINSAHYIRSTPGAGLVGLGQNIVSTKCDNIGLTITSSTIAFPANTVGKYLIVVAHVGTAAVLTMTAPTTTNCALQNTWFNSASSYLAAPGNGVTAAVCEYSFVVDIPQQTSGLIASATIGVGVFPSASLVDVVVTEVYDDYS